jgi:Holliday junction resolvase-like predicted endonuclease
MSRNERIHTGILREAVLALLKLTIENRLIKAEDLAEASILTGREAALTLESFTGEGLLGKDRGGFKVSPLQRVQLALKAVRLGVSPDRACKDLSWSEFEKAVKQALELNGYKAVSHLKIRVEGKFSEIDVFAVKGETALLIDCKHWKKPLRSSEALKIVEAQNRRVKALEGKSNLNILRVKMGGKINRKFYVIPIVVTLFEASQKILNGTPIVPVSKLPSFLNEIPAYIYILKRKLVRLEEN